MSLIKIQTEQGIKRVFIAGDGIADLATVELLPGPRQVRMGVTGNEHLGLGVARGAAVSGALVRVVIEGIVSGVITAARVDSGDRLTIAHSGCVVSLNSITPGGSISGHIFGFTSGYLLMNLVSGAGASGGVGVGGAGLSCTSGPLSGVIGAIFASGLIDMSLSSGTFVGTPFYTGRVIGKALTSGLSGLGIQMLVSRE